MVTSLEQLRAYSLTRSLWRERSLELAMTRFGFVQADPIRAPARAQDLMLRHRVVNYRAGDLERRYPSLTLEEDFFVNYGFMTRAAQRLMHPRRYAQALRIESEAPGLSEQVLEFVREHGPTHPKTLEQHFGKRSSGNYWGGSSQATTRALDGLHYRGKLRVARREAGIKVYERAAHLETEQQHTTSDLELAEGLIHVLVNLYAPLSLKQLKFVVRMLGYGAPHLIELAWANLNRIASEQLNQVQCAGTSFLYPLQERLEGSVEDRVRLLAPFDPIVWDRSRFEMLHGWEYRFEAYTPAAKRTRGYYALPLLWRDTAIGWANLKVVKGALETELGFVSAKPREKAFKLALTAELESMQSFLGLT